MIVVALLILIPVAIVLLLMDGSKPPVETYREQEQAGFTIEEKFSESLTNTFEDSEENDIVFELSEDELNTVIYQQLKKQNENYLIDDTPENAYFQVMNDMAGLVGAWTTVEEDGITIKLRGDLTSPIKFKTSITLKFKFQFNLEEDPGLMKLTLSQAKVGKIPLPKGIVNNVVKRLGLDLKSEVDELLTFDGVQVGTFQTNDWSITVDKILLAQNLLDGDVTISTLIKILTRNKLLNIDFSKDLIGAEFKLSKLYSDKALAVLPELAKLQNEAQKEAMLKAKTTNMLLSSLNSDEGELYVNLTEFDINRLLDYYFRDQATTPQSISLAGSEYKLQVLVPTMEIKSSGMVFNVKLELFEQANPTNKFITVFAVQIIPDMVDNDLMFKLGELHIGTDVNLTADETQDLLEILGANEMVEENMMVINNFLLNFSTNQIKAKGTNVNNGYLQLVYEGASAGITQTISDIKDSINNALEDIIAGNPEQQAAYDEFMDIPVEEITSDDVQNLIDGITQDMTPEQIDAFKQDLLDSLGGVGGIGELIPPEVTP